MKDKSKNYEDELRKIERKKVVYLIKNNLIFTTTDQLLEECNNKKGYINFLRMIDILFINEPEFLIFADEEADKILQVIDMNRNKYNEDEIKELERDIIIKLNIFKNEPKRDELKNKYIELQNKPRLCHFKSEKQLKKLIGYDAVVIQALENNDLENIEDIYFLISTSYLLDDFNDLYKYNKDYIDKSLDKISSVKESMDSNKNLKRKIKIIEKQLKKVAKRS